MVIGIVALRRLTPPGTLLARPILPAAVLLRGILTCAFFGVDAFVALTLVDWRGLSATEAGLALTAATISWTAGSWTQARGAARRPTYQFVRIGFAITTIGLAGMLLVLNPEVPWLFGVLTFGVAGLGMGLSYSPLALIVLRESHARDPGLGDQLAVADRFARDRDRDRADRGDGRRQRACHGRVGDRAGGRVRHRRRDRARRVAPDRPAQAAHRAERGPRPVAGVAAVVDAPDACGRLRDLSAASPGRRGPDHGGLPIVSAEELRAKIREVPDFPKPGILFYDITTLLKDPAAYKEAIDLMLAPFKDEPIDIVVGMESRGFIFSAPMAYLLGAGLVPVRKLGKLPAETITVEYALEYGSNTLEIHRDAISPGQRVLIVDDLLATGGTVHGTIELVERLKGEVVGLGFLVELDFLKGRDRLEGRRVTSVIQY